MYRPSVGILTSISCPGTLGWWGRTGEKAPVDNPVFLLVRHGAASMPSCELGMACRLWLMSLQSLGRAPRILDSPQLGGLSTHRPNSPKQHLTSHGPGDRCLCHIRGGVYSLSLHSQTRFAALLSPASSQGMYDLQCLLQVQMHF